MSYLRVDAPVGVASRSPPSAATGRRRNTRDMYGTAGTCTLQLGRGRADCAPHNTRPRRRPGVSSNAGTGRGRSRTPVPEDRCATSPKMSHRLGSAQLRRRLSRPGWASGWSSPVRAATAVATSATEAWR